MHSKSFVAVLFLLFVFTLGADYATYTSPDRQTYSRVVMDAFLGAKDRVKQYWTGFVTLVSALYRLSADKNRAKFQPSDFQEEGATLDEPRRIIPSRASTMATAERRLWDEAAPGNLTFDPYTYFGTLSPYVSKPTNETKYFVEYDELMSRFADIQENNIYFPAYDVECQHNGVPRNVTYLLYSCNGITRTKKKYLELSVDPNNKCSIRQMAGQVCLCPRDYYGQECTERVPLYCAHEWVAPKASEVFCNKSASGYDSVEYYDNTRYGIPPCLFVDKSRKYQFRLKLRCMNHPSVTEGVKAVQDYILEDLSNVSVKFDYWINTKQLTLTIPTEIHSILSFINYNHFTDTFQLARTVREKEEVQGDRAFEFDINFANMTKWRYGGRWYFELVAGNVNQKVPIRVVGIVDKAAIDDGTYVEPTEDHGLKWWAILLIVVGVLGTVALTALAISCYVKKANRDKALMSDD